MAKINRVVSKKSPNTSVSKSKVKPMGESGASYGKKARHDGATAKARDGKKAALSTNANDFKGELLVEGKLTAEQKAEILNIARNTGKTGPRDSAEQVVRIDDKPGKLRIFTSGHELAVSIGKRVHHSHKGGKLTIVWASDELPVRVHWTKKA
jgi:hypothetical protein